MKRGTGDDKDAADLDDLIARITGDAPGDDEKLRAFSRAFAAGVGLPADGFVVGEPVSVREIEYGGNVRRGLTARCRREDGSEHVIAACDVVFARGSSGAHHVGAYRQWLGLDPYPIDAAPPTRRQRQHKAATDDLDLSGPVELVVLAVKESAARCRLLHSDRVITVRSTGLWDVVPGEIVVVRPRKQWRYAGHPYLSGEIESTRLDVAALGLVPLCLDDMGMWDPRAHYWGEEGEPIEEWAKPIIARGRRPEFEMEQVLPGEDPDDPFDDPVTESNERKDAGDRAAARKILMELCQADLRCLDAHAHLGNFVFEHSPKEAIRHYEAGLRIGELSLGEDFDGLLPWGHVLNRPFLRCMHGYGLCLWRLGRHEEAARVFDKMLWLNPTDNQGARFLLAGVRSGRAWQECEDEPPMRARCDTDLEAIRDTPSWDWPEDAGTIFLEVLRDDGAGESERLLAAELAGSFSVIDDDLVEALLAIVRSGAASEALRAQAAISLGPILEHADTDGYESGFEDADEWPITERTLHRIRESLRELFREAGVPEEVRRRILEASVRAPEDWHEDAVRAAHGSDDEAWKLTAVFCMRFLRGFDEQILEALNSGNPLILCGAVRAAGNWGLQAAWPCIAALVTTEGTSKPVLLAAIEAATNIRPQDVPEIIEGLADSDDEDIVEAVDEALAMVEEPSVEDDEDDELDR